MAPGILRQRPVHEDRGYYRDAVPPAARPELIRNPWCAAPHNNMPSSYQVSTPIFTGKGGWTTFIKQSQAIGMTAHWTQQEKLHYLLVSLKEEAAEYAFDLEDDILEHYDALVHELALRFHVTSTGDSSQQLFYSRKIKPHESLREYTADLKRLILRAFPRGVSVEVWEDMTLKQFFDGLHDEDVRFHVKTSPAILQLLLKEGAPIKNKNCNTFRQGRRPHWLRTGHSTCKPATDSKKRKI